MGQSNMVGQGEIYGDYDGTLEYAVHKKKRYQHLLHSNGANTDTNSTTWAFKKNVRYAFINSNKGTFSIKRNDWLSVGGPRNKVGPEIEIGWILGDQYPDEPILLLKTCTGHRSLGWDLLPPGSKRFESNGEVYAGYHDVTEKWNKGSEPETVEDFEAFLDNSNGWYGGKQYDLDTRNAKKVLNRLENFYPGAKNGFEISGFFYWQGEKDRRTDAHTERYEENLVQFIRSVRKDFDAPEAPFVVSSVGFNGHNMEGRTRKIHQAQMAVDGNRRKYPDFEGNVKAVDARSIWRDEMKQSKQEEHYGYNAEAYMEVGSLMGWSMVQLLKQL
jgi:alpha-galactosidase